MVCNLLFFAIFFASLIRDPTDDPPLNARLGASSRDIISRKGRPHRYGRDWLRRVPRPRTISG